MLLLICNLQHRGEGDRRGPGQVPKEIEMQYRKDRYGKELSILGYGCMRFTKKGNSIDVDKAEKEIMTAVQNGVNYFDTAYLYPGNEAALGEIVARNNIRSRINIATKMPQYLAGSQASFDRFFNEELKRLQTDYIDYYLMHMFTDHAQWAKLKDLGMEKWIEEKKASGAIRNIGFSYHGNTENFLEILGDYDWDFCQIQYNYVDETSQAGKRGLKAAAEKGIPVVIMEPLRGGKLVNLLPKEARKLMAENERGWSPAQWGLKWLYDQPEVTVVLSGMNSMEMVEENIKTASESSAGELTEKDRELIEQVRQIIKSKEKVGCTGCRYCMPCPNGVDIPGTFSAYNTMFSESKGSGRKQYFQTVAITKQPGFATRCINCGKCEQHCPQGIKIREKLKEADKALRPLPYRIGLAVTRAYMLRKTKS